MDYKKAESPFALKDGKKATITVFMQKPGFSAIDIQHVKALFLSGTSDKMVLMQDVKGLSPWPSRGAVLSSSFTYNLADAGNTLELHPDIHAEYLEKGIIDKDGKCLTVKEAPAEKKVEAPITEATPEVAETVNEDVSPEADPLDVNKDGVVDAKDVAEVANAAAKEEASESELGDIGDDEEKSENDTAGDPA